MLKHMLSTGLAITVSWNTFSQAQNNHDLAIDVVEVTTKKTEQSDEEILYSDAPLTNPIFDAGALLRSVNGMDAARRGGRGFEPVIRGQSQNQINVISDGGFNFGACPGRMDPPSTYVGFDSFDKVSVIKGNRSVIFGAGGSGGTLLFEHQRPIFGDDNFQGDITGASTTNSELNSIAADIAAGNERGFVRVFGETLSSDNYEDGDGNVVSSAFDSKGFGIITGADINNENYLEASFERANKENIFYSGNGMDAPFADSDTVRLRWRNSNGFSFVDSFEANVYRSDVAHLMDNYSIRNRNMMPNGMAAPSSSDTWGGRFLANANLENSELKLGADMRANDRIAFLFSDAGKDGSYDMLVSLMWPGVEQQQIGIFGEWDYQFNDQTNIRLGLRYDDFESEATRANQTAGMMGSATPLNLYQNFYSTSNTKNESNDLSFVAGWDRIWDDNYLVSVNLSRSVRTPDATENFMARSAMSSNWVGNPDIAPEVHQQLDVTLISNTEKTEWSVTAFWDEVKDYIERYAIPGANLYRNTDATLRGIEFEAERKFLNHFNARLGLAYTRGKGDNGDLGQVSPLQGRLNVDYSRNTWAIGSEIISAAQQTHFNPAVDVDEATPSFTVMNVYGHWDASNTVTVEAGVENLLDETYAYHVNLSSSDPFDPTAVRVNEPGRQVWLKLRFGF